MVTRRIAYVLEVIMLTPRPHTALRTSGSVDRSHFVAQKSILKLDHARVREQKRWIISRYQRAAGHDLMATVGEELEELLANFSLFIISTYRLKCRREAGKSLRFRLQLKGRKYNA